MELKLKRIILLICFICNIQSIYAADVDFIQSINFSSPMHDANSKSHLEISGDETEYEINDNDIFFNIPYTSIFFSTTTNLIVSNSKYGLGLSIEGLLGMSGQYSSNNERPEYKSSFGLIDVGFSLGPSYKKELNKKITTIFDLKPGILITTGEFYTDLTGDLLLNTNGASIFMKSSVKFLYKASKNSNIVVSLSHLYGRKSFGVSSEYTKDEIIYRSNYHDIYIAIGLSI